MLPCTRPAPDNQSLIVGTDAFTTYYPGSHRIQNIRWKYLQRHRSATFTFTIASHCRDRDNTEPGVLTGKDILVQRECSFLRIAIGEGLAITRNWGIFRCFAYPDNPRTYPAQKAGLLRVPLTLVSRPQKHRRQHFTPYINSDLEREWANVPEPCKYSALLLFPLGYTSATVTHLVQHPAPPMFDSEVDAERAHQHKSQSRMQTINKDEQLCEDEVRTA